MNKFTLPKLWIAATIALSLFETVDMDAFAANNWNNTPNWAQQQGQSQQQQRRPAQITKQNLYKAPIPAPFTPDSNNLAIDVGQVFLLGNTGDRYNDALGLQLHYTYGVSEIFGFDASFGHSSHSEGRYSLTKLDTGLRTNLTWYDKVIPYAVVGLGFYKPSIRISDDNAETITSVSPVLFGLHLGTGITLQMTQQLFFGASLTFHDMFASTQTNPLDSKKTIEVDGTYTSFLLNAGISF